MWLLRDIPHFRHYLLYIRFLAFMCCSKKYRPTTALKLYYKTSQREAPLLVFIWSRVKAYCSLFCIWF